jgi:hypothetical protein
MEIVFIRSKLTSTLYKISYYGISNIEVINEKLNELKEKYNDSLISVVSLFIKYIQNSNDNMNNILILLTKHIIKNNNIDLLNELLLLFKIELLC